MDVQKTGRLQTAGWPRPARRTGRREPREKKISRELREKLNFQSPAHLYMENNDVVSSPVDVATDLAGLSLQPAPRLLNLPGSKWECRSDAHQGRFLVAKEDIQAGDVVISELPFAFVPFDGPRAQVRAIQLLAERKLPLLVQFLRIWIVSPVNCSNIMVCHRLCRYAMSVASYQLC